MSSEPSHDNPILKCRLNKCIVASPAIGHRGACPLDFQLIGEESCTPDSHILTVTRLEKLTLCGVERNLVQAADIDKIVDRFSALGDNSCIVLN